MTISPKRASGIGRSTELERLGWWIPSFTEAATEENMDLESPTELE